MKRFIKKFFLYLFLLILGAGAVLIAVFHKDIGNWADKTWNDITKKQETEIVQPMPEDKEENENVEITPPLVYPENKE